MASRAGLALTTGASLATSKTARLDGGEVFGCSMELFAGARQKGLSPGSPQPGQGTARS